MRKQNKSNPKTRPNFLDVSFEVPGHIAFKRLEVIDRRKYRQRERVPELTGCMNKGLGISVNSCIRELDRKRVRVCCQTGVTWATQRRRDTIEKFGRAVTMVVAIEKG